jgi:hypothetical protein
LRSFSFSFTIFWIDSKRVFGDIPAISFPKKNYKQRIWEQSSRLNTIKISRKTKNISKNDELSCF